MPVHASWTPSTWWTRSFALVSAMALGAAAAGAQATASATSPSTDPRLAGALRSLAHQAEALNSAIPAFECTETGVSYEQHGSKRKRVSNFTATIRAQRDAQGVMQETFRTTELNGRPYNSDSVNLTLYVNGPFSDALRPFASDRHACYDYAFLDSNQISLKEKSGGHTGCLRFFGRAGLLTLDAEGNATRLEEYEPVDPKRKEHYLSSAVLELRPVELNGQTYRLLSEFHATMPYGDYTKVFEAKYQNCHRFAATVTLLPGSTVVHEEPAPK